MVLCDVGSCCQPVEKGLKLLTALESIEDVFCSSRKLHTSLDEGSLVCSVEFIQKIKLDYIIFFRYFFKVLLSISNRKERILNLRV